MNIIRSLNRLFLRSRSVQMVVIRSINKAVISVLHDYRRRNCWIWEP